MIDYLITVIYAALVAAFILCFCYKTGIIAKLQRSKIKLISELAGCEFCLSFWGSVILMFVLVIVHSDISHIFMPVMSAPITRRLIL